ncbi:hypothetical protein AG0111_0g11467 [Alternaria gaisen]|uniref:Uncharacterized protein n=1 Tax=Alternaria gaisen TaxID=167740 RepID=A0ACB6F7K3_9PLEO|nr:hypothetical protein AG0111_0g11467 [Alternaria gaisen]
MVPFPELQRFTDDFWGSLGEPWVRRMWAGGSIQLKPNGYLDYARRCTAGTVMAGTEQIKHVRLHGEGDTAKIFVTIERRFAGLEDAERGVAKGKHGKRPPGVSVHPQEARGDLTQQLRAKVDDGWGDAVLKEERNLVFFKERTAAELEAVKAGQMATVKYLDPPGKPDFSHTLTPNRALLFRFSALTFNAHLIHLDPDYARNVEGHRNLLVHGPLSLTLMLKTVNHYVHQQTKGKQVSESIEYRNLAPLYCDEEMRICCSEKKKLQNGSIYDVWIEGPTGGVAVKGTLRTTTNDAWTKKDTGIAQTHSATPIDELKTKWPSFKRPEYPKLKRKLLNTTNRARKMAKSSKNGTQVHVASGDQRPSQDSPTPPSSEPTTNPEPSADSESSTSSEPSAQKQGEIPSQSTSSGTTSQPPCREVTSAIAHETNRAYRRKRAHNTKAYNFITLPPSEPPPARIVNAYTPVKPTLSVRAKELLRRARRRKPAKIKVDPIPLVRRFDARAYTPDPVQTAARHSRYLRRGVRKMEKLKIRHVALPSGRETGRRRVVIKRYSK